MNAAEREARIRQLAQHIWEAEGCPDGQALRHWAMAERLVDAEIRAAVGNEPQPPTSITGPRS